uniref:Uncharacterized protein n=1 Tax=Meloidogyne javanica TaxID=6303 RepID=A0A915MIB4_MELJA
MIRNSVNVLMSELDTGEDPKEGEWVLGIHAQRDQLNHAIHSAEGALAYGRLQRKED